MLVCVWPSSVLFDVIILHHPPSAGPHHITPQERTPRQAHNTGWVPSLHILPNTDYSQVKLNFPPLTHSLLPPSLIGMINIHHFACCAGYESPVEAMGITSHSLALLSLLSPLRAAVCPSLTTPVCSSASVHPLSLRLYLSLSPTPLSQVHGNHSQISLYPAL